MKKIALIFAIALSSLFYNSADAQIRLHFGIHFGLPPVFVPRVVVQQQPAEYCEPANYNGDEDYYYLPDVDAYYSVPEQCYYYNDGGNWVSAACLPGAYRDYDWQNARRFEVRAPRPFMHNDYYRTRFNGVNFNGRWDRGYDRAYANNNSNHDQYRNDDRRVDNRGWGRDDHQFNQNRDQHFDQNRDQHFDNRGQDNRRNDQDRFAQNNAQRNNGWNGGNNHRQARF